MQKNNYMKKTLNIFIHSLGIIILAIFIYFKIDLKKFLETFSQSNLLFLFPIFISAFFMFLFKALRWNLLNTMLGSKYPFWKSINVYLTGVLFSLSTPGKLGDFIKIYYLKKDLSLSYTSAFCSTFLDRIFDLLMLMLFSLTGIYIFSQNQIIVIGIFFLFFFILVYILIQKKILLNIVSFIFNRLIKKSAKDNMTLNNFLDSINKLVSIKQIFPFLFSIISYLFNFLTAFLILISLDMNISFFYLIPCV